VQDMIFPGDPQVSVVEAATVPTRGKAKRDAPKSTNIPKMLAEKILGLGILDARQHVHYLAKLKRN
jgi:hypothetical protein